LYVVQEELRDRALSLQRGKGFRKRLRLGADPRTEFLQLVSTEFRCALGGTGPVRCVLEPDPEVVHHLQDRALPLRRGPGGLAFGGKVVILDQPGQNPVALVFHRLNALTSILLVDEDAVSSHPGCDAHPLHLSPQVLSGVILNPAHLHEAVEERADSNHVLLSVKQEVRIVERNQSVVVVRNLRPLRLVGLGDVLQASELPRQAQLVALILQAQPAHRPLRLCSVGVPVPAGVHVGLRGRVEQVGEIEGVHLLHLLRHVQWLQRIVPENPGQINRDDIVPHNIIRGSENVPELFQILLRVDLLDLHRAIIHRPLDETNELVRFHPVLSSRVAGLRVERDVVLHNNSFLLICVILRPIAIPSLRSWEPAIQPASGNHRLTVAWATWRVRIMSVRLAPWDTRYSIRSYLSSDTSVFFQSGSPAIRKRVRTSRASRPSRLAIQATGLFSSLQDTTLTRIFAFITLYLPGVSSTYALRPEPTSRPHPCKRRTSRTLAPPRLRL